MPFSATIAHLFSIETPAVFQAGEYVYAVLVNVTYSKGRTNWTGARQNFSNDATQRSHTALLLDKWPQPHKRSFEEQSAAGAVCACGGCQSQFKTHRKCVMLWFSRWNHNGHFLHPIFHQPQLQCSCVVLCVSWFGCPSSPSPTQDPGVKVPAKGKLVGKQG